MTLYRVILLIFMLATLLDIKDSLFTWVWNTEFYNCNCSAHKYLKEKIVFIKVTPDLRGCPREKNSYVRHFKGKHGKLYIVGKLNRCSFREKKYKLQVSSILQKKIVINRENVQVSFN